MHACIISGVSRALLNTWILIQVCLGTTSDSAVSKYSDREREARQQSVLRSKRTSAPNNLCFSSVLCAYWLSSLRLRSELAQLLIRLHSWMLASSEAELCNWVVAQRSLVRTASSASSKTGCRVVFCGQTGGRMGASVVVEAGGGGDATTGGGNRALPPAAAPSQCSGLGWGTNTLAWLLVGPPLSSGAAAGTWAASCRSLTWDKAACGFRAIKKEKKKEDKLKHL